MSDATIFYIVGGTLATLSVVIAFVGMRSENFPSASQMKAVIPLFAVMVAASATWAVLSAREEQAHKAEEAKHAAEEGTEHGPEEEQAPSEQDDPSKEPVENDGPGDASAGAAVFVDIGCGGCHTLADAGSDAAVGPDLDQALEGKDAEFIETAIVDPNADVAAGFGPDIMPGNYGEELSSDDLADLVAYLLEVVAQ